MNLPSKFSTLAILVVLLLVAGLSQAQEPRNRRHLDEGVAASGTAARLPATMMDSLRGQMQYSMTATRKLSEDDDDDDGDDDDGKGGSKGSKGCKGSKGKGGGSGKGKGGGGGGDDDDDDSGKGGSGGDDDDDDDSGKGGSGDDDDDDGCGDDDDDDDDDDGGCECYENDCLCGGLPETPPAITEPSCIGVGGIGCNSNDNMCCGEELMCGVNSSNQCCVKNGMQGCRVDQTTGEGIHTDCCNEPELAGGYVCLPDSTTTGKCCIPDGDDVLPVTNTDLCCSEYAINGVCVASP